MKQHSTEMKLNGSTWKTAIAVAAVRMAKTAQAQLFIDVYPSQDNDNQTIWIFSGSSTANYGSSIRSI